MKSRAYPFLGLIAIASLFACSAKGVGGSGTGGSGAKSSTGAGNGGPGTGTGMGGNLEVTVGVGSGGSTSSGMACNHSPDQDGDGDGFTSAQGDCNDCDPNVNPGAVDLGMNEDCDPNTGPVAPCDSALAIDDATPMSGAKAIELCQATDMNSKKWGVLDVRYANAAGAPKQPGVQAGLLPSFGPNVHVQAGGRMLALSSGAARQEKDPGACGNLSCQHGNGAAPVGFPQDVPNCAGDKTIYDDIALEVRLRAPTNATGYKFNFKFYSFEFPFYVCSAYNDQFIALVSPPPMGSINGNISFDKNKNPVSVNIAFFDVCDPSSVSDFATDCMMSGGNCPATPNPYCPSGPSQLAGTGFEIWNLPQNDSGATSWLATQAPIKGGEVFSIRFAIWDTGDQNLDSTTLVDNFQWIANGGTVGVGTTPVDNPK